MPPIPIKADSTSRLAAMREDYNVHSKLQLSAIEASKPYIELGVNAYRGLPCTERRNKTITLADFGSSVGANSSRAMSMIIANLRAKFGYEATKSILVVHNDLPRNSWMTLFDYLYNDEASYGSKFEGVFSVASGQSFFKQIFPSNWLHFGYSSSAIHWLSELPSTISDHCFAVFATSPEERELFKKISDKDWQCFLRARSAEFVPGGVLVISCPANKGEGWQKHRTSFDALYLSAKRLVDEENLMTEEELRNFNIRCYFRDYNYMTNPALLESFGFELISANYFELDKNPFYSAYQAHKDVNRFADEMSGTMEAGAEAPFLEAIAETRSAQEKKAICRALWTNYKEAIKANPDQFKTTGCGVFMVLRKK